MRSIQEQLIEAIEASGESRYQIAIGSGVSQSQLSRLFSGESDLSTANVERVAEYLGLELVLRPKRKGGRA
jgi:transcriptional regulator with XRE-family HTH domain